LLRAETVTAMADPAGVLKARHAGTNRMWPVELSGSGSAWFSHILVPSQQKNGKKDEKT